MNPKSIYLLDLIYKKLKNYKPKQISLEKEDFKKFIFSLFKEVKEEWNEIIINENVIVN